MKLRNKKTGEIIEVLAKISFIKRNDNFIDSEVNTFDSLAKLNENWEDYEEPKDHYYIDYDGDIMIVEALDYEPKIKGMKQIGNYFETREEAEIAVCKLKAWKRLKDAGVSFKPTTVGHKWYLEPHASPENRTFKESQDLYKDVMLFFGGEDDKK